MNGEILSTAFALIALAACGVCAWGAYHFARVAADAAGDLIRTAGKVKAHDLTLDAHHLALQRINGKLGRLTRDGEIPREPRRRALLDGETGDVLGDAADVDDEFTAALQLQGAPAASPGSRGRGNA